MENNRNKQIKCNAVVDDCKSNIADRGLSQKDNLESPNFDASSSILEFLDQERKCLNSAGGDASDVDIKSIIEEIHRLSSDTTVSGRDASSNNAGERSVDEILKEAERLVVESSDTFNVLRTSSKSLQSKSKKILPVKENNRKLVGSHSDIVKTNNICRMAAGDNEDSSGRADSPSYDDTFDTSSDAKSLPDDHINTESLQSLRDTVNNVLDVIDHDKTFEFEKDQLAKRNPALNRTYVQPATTCDVSNSASVLSLSGKSIFNKLPDATLMRDSCTSPVWPGEPLVDAAAFQKCEERISDLEERLQGATLQHNSVAASFRSLTLEHAELQKKSEGLQAEVTRLQDMLRSSTYQLEKHMDITKQLRDANENLQKNMQVERENSRTIQNQDEVQKRKIQDLQRQVREMERILARKHPDSVSALIVASKMDAVVADEATRKLLEDRIAQLEDSSKQQSAKSQSVLQNVQDKFNNMQLKYEAHISDLESQVFSLQQINMEHQQRQLQNKRDVVDAMNQTEPEVKIKPPTPVPSPSSLPTRSPSLSPVKPKKTAEVGIQTTKLLPKPIVTKNIKQNLNNNISSQKEETHLLATIRGLKQELTVKDKTMTRLSREVEDLKKTVKKLKTEREAINKAHAHGKPKEYDPQTFTCTPHQEQDEISARALQLLQREYHALIEKRLHDLNALQNSHERELAGLERTIHALHNRIHEKDATILSLKGQIKTKVSALEKRQIEREQTLKSLVSKLSNGKLDKDWINM